MGFAGYVVVNWVWGELAGCLVSAWEEFGGLGVAVYAEARSGSSGLQWVLSGFLLTKFSCSLGVLMVADRWKG